MYHLAAYDRADDAPLQAAPEVRTVVRAAYQRFPTNRPILGEVHQREVGASYFDAVAQVIAGGMASTTALTGSTEEAQFNTKS